MSFWQNVQSAAGMGRIYAWVMLGFVLGSLVLFAWVPAERARIRRSMLMFIVSFAGFLAAGGLISFGVASNGAPYRWLTFTARFIELVAIVNVASVLVFDIALGAAYVRLPRIMRDLLLGLAYLVFAISLLSRSGVELSGIVATSAVITAVIGLSFQDTLGNMMGGLAIQMERAIAVGDWVRIDQQEGRVTEIRWRHTSIETRNWDTVIIPNSVLMRSQVTIIGRRTGMPRQQRQWVYFNVDFRYSPADVIDAVETALCSEPIANIAREPQPNCIFTDFKDSYANYAVRYWLTDLSAGDPTNSVVRERIYFALRRAEIPLSIPAQSLFITEDDAQRRERKLAQEIDKRVKALRQVELFHSLTDEELRELAPRLKVSPFVRGEAITRQGQQAHWLYIITKGEVEVEIAFDGSNLARKVATLHEGDFFGEMGMMTGEPRSATVFAISDVECYRVDKDAFHDILQRRPEIAEDISHVMARRRLEYEVARGELTEEAKHLAMQHTQGDLLQRIRKFFLLDATEEQAE
jgi:small-conductance mechanosensitive channel/CRP-like cAMP-binding protein